MGKEHYVVNCYTCQHNGQETCKGCNTLLNGEDEPYQNWKLREDLEQKDNKIADLQSQLQQANEIINNPDTLIFQQQQLIDNLKLQLAEKDKEIEISKSTIDFYKSYYISFKEKVIDELEKVKEEMTYNGNGYCEVRQCSSSHTPNLNFAWFNYVVFNKFIDNQITQLKEGK